MKNQDEMGDEEILQGIKDAAYFNLVCHLSIVMEETDDLMDRIVPTRDTSRELSDELDKLLKSIDDLRFAIRLQRGVK